jgi:hypothetical protein
MLKTKNLTMVGIKMPDRTSPLEQEVVKQDDKPKDEVAAPKVEAERQLAEEGSQLQKEEAALLEEERQIKEEEAALLIEEEQIKNDFAAVLKQEETKLDVEEEAHKQKQAEESRLLMKLTAASALTQQKEQLLQDDHRRAAQKRKELDQAKIKLSPFEKAVGRFSEVSEGARSATELLMRFHHALAVFESTLTFFPPLRLAMGAVLSGLEIFSAFYEKNISHWNRAAKVALALAFVAMLATAIAIPALAGIFVAAAMGVQMLKEYRELATKISHYYETRREIRPLERAIGILDHDIHISKEAMVKLHKELLLHPEGPANDIMTAHIHVLSERLAKNKFERARLENKLPELKAQRYKRGVDVIESSTNWLLASVSLVGSVMLFFPPVALIGLGLLIGAVGVGLGVKLATFLTKKIGTPAVPAHALAGEHLTPELEKGLAIAPDLAVGMRYLENNALLQAKKELTLEDPTWQEKSPLLASTTPTAPGMNVMQTAELAQGQVSATTGQPTTPRPSGPSGAKQKEDDEGEGEAGPHPKT